MGVEAFLEGAFYEFLTDRFPGMGTVIAAMP
jgi:hypothetical protein